MDYGVHLPVSGPAATPENLLLFVRRAEALGFFCVTVSDHIAIPERLSSRYPFTLDGRYPGGGHHLEQLSVLAFLAAATKSIRLATSVMVLPYRHPVLAAKALATIDFLSGGRVILGAGAGWMEEEFRLVGAPPFAERGAVADEYLRAFQALWREERPRFAGRYASFSDLIFLPKPVQKPRIPIWIGGHGERALRRAGELGDGWHPIGAIPAVSLEPGELRLKRERLSRYARAAGRDPAEIRIVLKATRYDRGAGARRQRFTGSAEEIAADIREYESAGVDCVILDVRAPEPAASLERMEWLAREVIPRAQASPRTI